jgi:putative ABC transport system substrate-binding protein
MQFAKEGALISYGPDTADIVRRSAGDRPTFRCRRQHELVKALTIEIPPALLARADEVIE